MSKKQVSRANRSASGTSARAVRGRAGRTQLRASQAGKTLRARQMAAQAQLAPFATSARMTAQQGVYGARVWAAPRLDQMGRNLQDRVAPRMSTMLSAAARRIDPAKPRRRRWPLLAAGIVMIAGGSAVAAVMLSRRNQGLASDLGRSGETSRPSASQREMAGADAVGADANGRVQNP